MGWISVSTPVGHSRAPGFFGTAPADSLYKAVRAIQ